MSVCVWYVCIFISLSAHLRESVFFFLNAISMCLVCLVDNEIMNCRTDYLIANNSPRCYRIFWLRTFRDSFVQQPQPSYYNVFVFFKNISRCSHLFIFFLIGSNHFWFFSFWYKLFLGNFSINVNLCLKIRFALEFFSLPRHNVLSLKRGFAKLE